MKPLSECSLYAFIDTAYLRERDITLLAQALCQGGADLVQLRAKNSSPDEVRRMGECILPIIARANVGLVINDHWEIAAQLGADLCHLGQEDFFGKGLDHVSQLATINGRPALGLSTHTPEQAQRALAAQPAYVAIGPVFHTPTKPNATPVTLDYVRWAAKNVKIPWFAIGGITLENVQAVIDAGAKGVCVVSAILNAADVTKACRDFARFLKENP
jgi:thiamine-phosphate pyrophosphorylase